MAEPDFAIIANPTACHLETAIALANAGIPFLMEKPVADSLEGLDQLALVVKERCLPVMVGFQMRYHPTFKKLQSIKVAGEIGRPLSLRGHVGQYLPDWRPDSDYRQGYSARRELGGGVIGDLCHEIDIALQVMGPVDRVTSISGRISDLDIDTEDVAEIVLQHEAGNISNIHLNYVERGYRWQTRIVGSKGNLHWDYAGGYLRFESADGSIRKFEDSPDFIRDDLFRAQLRTWLAVVTGRAEPVATLEQGIDVTRVCCAAKQSSAEGRHIKL